MSSGCQSLVGGGSSNTSSGRYSAIVNGSGNTASGCRSFIANGQFNNTCGLDDAMIVGSCICADRVCTTFVNALSMKTAPTQIDLPLPIGTIYVDTSDGNRLKMA